MNYSFFLARRIGLSEGGRKSSPAVKVAVTAVALAVAVMLASVSIVLGFKREIRDKVIGFNSHISIYAVPAGETDTNLLTLTPTLSGILDDMEFVSDYSLEASIPAILKTKTDFKGVYMRSLGGESIRKFLSENLEEGTIPDYSDEKEIQKAVISRIAANQLRLKTGDRIDTYFISDDVRVRRLEIAGIFNSHFDTYDGIYIYGALPLIQQLGGIGEKQGTSLMIHTDDFNRVGEYSDEIRATLDKALAEGLIYRHYKVQDALTQGAGYFQWLSLLDTNVIVILLLMTVVAIATLISGMLIIILDKKRFIGIIRSLGTPVRNVRKIFVFLAMKVALIGLLAGNALMLSLLWAQQRWHLLRLDPDAYYIDFVPVEMAPGWFLMLNAGILAVIYLSLILPSIFAAKISPAETMRYE